jgi:hypothetical protein
MVHEVHSGIVDWATPAPMLGILGHRDNPQCGGRSYQLSPHSSLELGSKCPIVHAE